MQRGIRVKTSSFTRHHEHHDDAGQGGQQLQQLQSWPTWKRWTTATTRRCCSTARLRVRGAGENVFVIKDGVVYTPDLSAGALNGITRNTVMHICKDLGIELVQKRITRDEIYIADEASSPAPPPK